MAVTVLSLNPKIKWCHLQYIQVILQAEEGLKELDAGINELKKRVEKLQIDQPSVQELSKIQVWIITSILDLSGDTKAISMFLFIVHKAVQESIFKILSLCIEDSPSFSTFALSDFQPSLLLAVLIT